MPSIHPNFCSIFLCSNSWLSPQVIVFIGGSVLLGTIKAMPRCIQTMWYQGLSRGPCTCQACTLFLWVISVHSLLTFMGMFSFNTWLSLIHWEICLFHIADHMFLQLSYPTYEIFHTFLSGWNVSFSHTKFWPTDFSLKFLLCSRSLCDCFGNHTVLITLAW